MYFHILTHSLGYSCTDYTESLSCVSSSFTAWDGKT